MERKFHSAFNHVITYISVLPYFYRYEDKKYIEKFFDTGELYISSFHNYKKYEDNELGDKSEGGLMSFGNTENNLTFGTYSKAGFNEYTFCTSTILDKKLLHKFSRESAFRIKDPINFILEITRSLPRVMEVVHGNCIYLDDKMIIRNIPGVEMDSLKDASGNIILEKLFAISNLVVGLDDFFIKHKEYQDQAEYRILWKTDRKVTDGIIINCPEAIKFCEKVNDNEF